MLTFENKCWKFKSEQELNSFLNDAMDSGDDYHIINHGLSSKNEWYAFGYIIAHVKFGVKAQQQQQAQAIQQQVTPNVTTF